MAENMRHGRFPNGLRKVELVDDLGRVTTLRLSGEGTLREAIGDIWEASKTDDSRTAVAYWSTVSSFTARCGDEIAEFKRGVSDWMDAPVKDRIQ